jgi:outer membrane protein TolC
MQQVWGTYKLVTKVAALLALVCLGLGGKQPHAQGQTSPARLTFSPVAPADPPSPGSPLPLSVAELSGQQPCWRGLAPGDSGPDDEARLLPINLGTALRLAATNHLDIAQAREVVNQAQVQFERARMLILPSLNVGSTYVAHDGNIQKTEGNIIKANRDSLFVGGGPSMVFGFADALFAPLVAQQTRAATEAGLQRIQSDALLAVADSYFAVLRARRRLARVEATLDFLAAEKPSPARAGSKGLLQVVEAMQKAGAAAALKAEVHRVQVEVLRRREERTAALQELRVAVAELARLLRLDPTLPLWPLEDFRVPLELPEPGEDQPEEALVRLALNNRPELAENQALVRAAVERVRTAQWRPWLPNLVLNYNWGDFGGGPDLNPAIVTPATKTSPAKVTAQPGFGPSGQLHHVSPRDDFDVTLLWRLQNLGLGNLAEIREQESLARQIRLHQIQLQDRVAAEVVQTLEQVKGWKERVAVTRSALFDSAGKPNGPVFEGIRLNFDRVREVQTARPLEVLDSIRGLNDLLDAYGQAVTDYERARFRLMIVVGLSPEDIISWVVDPKGLGCGP